eukprot:UN34453
MGPTSFFIVFWGMYWTFELPSCSQPFVLSALNGLNVIICYLFGIVNSSTYLLWFSTGFCCFCRFG